MLSYPKPVNADNYGDGHTGVKKSYIGKVKKAALLYSCLCFFTTRLFAQLPEYHVQKLHVKNGLVQPRQVDEMMRDSKGFLWLLTPTKAQRFDGKNILSFSFNDRCIGIQEDEEGAIWLASRQNIYRFKNAYEGFEKLPVFTSTVNKYISILRGRQKNLYLLSTEGLVKWAPAKNNLGPVNIFPFKAGGSFNFLEAFGDWLFFRFSKASVVRLNTKTGAVDSVAVQEPNFFVPLDEDHIWMRQGIASTVLVSFKTKTVTTLNSTQFSEAFTDNNFFITAAYRGRTGEFFTIIQDKGYFTYSPATNSFKRVNFFNNGMLLTGKPLLTRNNFFQEKDGTAWFTNEEGIFLLNPYTASIKVLRSQQTASADDAATGQPADGAIGWNNDVRNFAEDNNGNIWFTTADGFCKWNKKSGKVTAWHANYTATNYLNYSSGKAMGFANNKIIVGQSEKGFWLFDPMKQTFSRPKFEADSLRKKFENEFNRNMLKLRDGNFLILSNGLWVLDTQSFYIKPVKVHATATASRKAYEDEQGRIWLLGSRGIVALDKDFALLYYLDDTEKGKWYNAIVQKDENTFWVAAKSLYEIKLLPQKKLAIKPIFPELKNQHFSNLFKDAVGHIWMCHDEGMGRYIPEKNIVEKFDRSDNIQDFYVGVSNHFRGSDGTVYFGSLSGINYFVPEQLPLQTDSLQVLLLNITVNKDDSSFLLNRPVQNLRHFQNSIVFDFVTPWLYNAEKVQYRYKLNGADAEWISLGNATSVHFNSLQPASYSFVAQASLNGKDWYGMAAPFSFIIQPPFYNTWWFRAVTITCAAAFIFFYFRKRIQTIKTKAVIRQQITELEIKALRAQMNPHFIFNAMNSIQQFTLKNDVDNANLYISKVSTLLRKVLHSSQQNFIVLEEEIEQLQLYLEIEKQRMGNEFTYVIITDEEIETDALKIPGMLIQPFVENALKHGLSPKEGCKKLEIEFGAVADNKISVTITDNGIGRRKAGNLKAQQEKFLPHTSNGIRLVEERLQLLNHTHGSTNVRFQDVCDVEGNPAGTKVFLSISLHTAI